MVVGRDTCTDDSRLSCLVLTYIDEANINPRHHMSATSSSTSTANHHQQQPHPCTTGVNQPALVNHGRPFDLHSDLQRHPASISPPPYWPVTSSAVAMTSRGGDVAASGDYTVSYQHQHGGRRGDHRRESCRDDVSDDVTSPMYAEKIVAELIETERTYVAELQQIVQVTTTSHRPRPCQATRPSEFTVTRGKHC